MHYLKIPLDFSAITKGKNLTSESFDIDIWIGTFDLDLFPI